MTATDFNTLLAKNDGTTLVSHTTAVKNMTIALCENVNDDINFKKRCVTAAVLHDIGKCTNEFQNDLKTSDCPTIIRHNIISWAVSCCCFPNNSAQRQISNAVLYHHVAPVGVDSETKAFDIYQTLTDDEKNMIIDFYNAFDDVIPMSAEVEVSTSDYTQVPLFDITKSKSNGIANCNDEEALLLRAILVAADRIVSSNEYDNTRIEHNDVDYMKTIIEENNIIKSVNDFDTQSALEHTYDMIRLHRQIDIVDESLYALNNGKNTMMVNASAGFGKTLLGLISILKRRRKTVWCVPTREIAMSTFSSICDELKKMKCPLSVCLFYGNEIQDTFTISKNTQDYINIKNFDIVVSVIDSMLSRFHNNNSGHLLYSLLTDDVIFDEYHNVVTDNALFAAASLLWDTRICKTDAYSLFLSATPLFPIQPIIKNTDKSHVGNSHSKITQEFRLFNGTTYVAQGHFDWHAFDQTFSNDNPINTKSLLKFISDIIGVEDVRKFTFREVIYKLSKYWHTDDLEAKVKKFFDINYTNNAITVSWMYILFGCVWVKGIISREKLTAYNGGYKGKTPLLYTKGITSVMYINGDICCPITDEMINKISENMGTATILDGGLVYITEIEIFDEYRLFYEGFTKILNREDAIALSKSMS